MELIIVPEEFGWAKARASLHLACIQEGAFRLKEEMKSGGTGAALFQAEQLLLFCEMCAGDGLALELMTPLQKADIEVAAAFARAVIAVVNAHVISKYSGAVLVAGG